MKEKEHIMKIGLGTAALGRPQYINLKQDADDEVSLDAFREQGWQVLEEAFRKGIRYFDTAPGYGMAEQLIIDWINEKKYNDIEIATKWGYTYVANFNPNAKIHEIKDHSISKLNQQWNQSKSLLPFLTSYQVHSATLDSGILDNRGALTRLSELKNEFGLRIGLTTSGANQSEIIDKSLEIIFDGNELFDVFQVTYNLMDQSLFQIAQILLEKEKRIVIKEALANGRLFPNSNYPQYEPLYQYMEKLATKYNTGIDAIAIRFCMDSLKPFMVLSGASNEIQLSQNLKAANIELEEKEILNLQKYSVPPENYWQERKQLGWN